MLDFFTIFSKGGIVLWCFQGAGVTESFTGPVNALIRSVILQERSGNNSFTHEKLSLKYKLDNEFELIFVVGFQKILTLTYVDKFIDDVQLHFRDRYKNELEQKGALKLLNNSFEFEDDFKVLLRDAEESSKVRSPAQMRSFKESEKSQKTVKSMIETKGGDKGKEQGGKKSKNTKKEGDEIAWNDPIANFTPHEHQKILLTTQNSPVSLCSFSIMFYLFTYVLLFLFVFLPVCKMSEYLEKCYIIIVIIIIMFCHPSHSKSPKPQKPREKQMRVWDMGGSSTKNLDYSERNGDGSSNGGEQNQEREAFCFFLSSKKGGGFGGMFGMLKGLVGSKSLSREDMEPVLEKMRDHLIAKNVAADIASQLCDSVAKKLEGKVMGTFTTVASTVKQALQDSLVQILQPKRRVDILRDVMEAQSQRRPFVITFCGVNGVGKSTNLAKISYWLIENGFTVLIAACDTFRAGAVEQLRTHQRRLNSLHPPEKHGGRPVVQLYEKGYGKDAAGIAMEAIAYARNQAFDVVLVDTAGRMQDNAPLMTALAKLIAVNMPDLVLFVGEALVGNEAVDQLVKFNQALADHSMSDKPRLIDGIVLTKFDTIDDKMGAAISMTYITGQPIVFVGTGQTYNDLRSLNARAVVSALMKA
uniref:SRP receptor subunit alpha n=1 Tax=Stegastes partitus TaxID=144197 RepID=A0A3B4ZGF9_9TELE